MPGDQEKATALLSQIPLGAIIGGPLKAAVDAQAAAAVACYDFVRKVGFSDETDDQQKPTGRSRCTDITFSFVRDVPPAKEGDPAQKATMTLTVPILTIMPLPFIRIESLTVSFKASISAVDTQSQDTRESSGKDAKLEGSVGFPLWKAGISGGISSKKDSSSTNSSKYSVEHTMDVSMHAVQDDMPAGLAKLLALMTESIVASSPK